MIKVSVIIPVYNVEKYLDECLKSIINQSLKDIEIICINDGSTDNSLAILEAYEKRDSRGRGRLCGNGIWYRRGEDDPCS